MLRDRPFNSAPANVTLSLLHINHQISAEAVSMFPGKRTLNSSPKRLIPFLEGIALCRHLIKDMEVLETPAFELRFPPQTFDFLQSLDGLRSFTMRIGTDPFHRLQEHLIEAGIYKLTDRMVVVVYSEHRTVLNFTKNGMFNLEYILFTNNLTCAKGEKEFKSRGFYCKVLSHEGGGIIGVRHMMNTSCQPCNHSHHRPGRY